MKKIILITILLTSINLFGQTEKGTFQLGGGLNFNALNSSNKFKTDDSSRKRDKNTRFALQSNVGYFIVNNFATGLQISVSNSKTESPILTLNGTINQTYKSTSVLASPFIRYYFSKTKIKPYLQAHAGVGSGNFTVETDDESDSQDKTSLFSYGGDGGVAFFLNDNVAVNAGLNYTSLTAKNKNAANNGRSITSVFSFGVGFDIFL